MKIFKERKDLLIKILAVVLLVFMCYILSAKTFHWVACGEKDRREVDILFLFFCPKEVNQWYENLYWEDCAKQDKQIPPNTELLISACKNPVVRGIPGGEVLFVKEFKTGEIYLLDLRTGEKTSVPDGQLLWDEGVFLSSELVWLKGSPVGPGDNGYRPHYILDLKDGKRYELVDLTWVPLKDGKFDTQNYEYIKFAEHVFYYPKGIVLIALAPNFRQNLKQNVIHFDSSLEQLLNDLGVNYELVDYSLRYADVPSPTGKYVVRRDGIYFSGDDIPVITRENAGDAFASGTFEGWYYDESGVVFAQYGYYHQMDSILGARFYLPRPIIKLNLPTP